MKEKTWRKGLVEPGQLGHAPSGPAAGSAKAPISASDMYRDANNALGMMFREFARFFGGDKAANKVRVGSGSGGRRRTAKPNKKKGWF